MPLLYMAGPLLDGHTLTFEQGKKNWEKVVDIADKLMQKGWTVHVPHHSLFMWNHIKETQGRDIPWKTWMTQDSGMIQLAQAVYFVGHSKGADIELEYAMNTNKAVYFSVNDVPEVIPDDCLTRVDKPQPKPYEVEVTESNIQE